MDRFAQRLWYERRYAVLSVLLLPLSWLFAVVVALRRLAYRTGLLGSVRVIRPVVVVGNLTVGGTGKTPLVVWLANECLRRGLRAGVVCRGYGGKATGMPALVTAGSDPKQVGDEAVLLAQSFDGIVVAGTDRVAAAERAVELGADLILADDGLQHYRLQRDSEIVVVDGARGLGNGRLLPAGPLREPRRRARKAQLVVRTRRDERVAPMRLAGLQTIEMRTRLGVAISLASGEVRPLASFREERVHALAGIGHPDAFFGMLRAHGLTMDTRTLPDHGVITAAELQYGDSHPVLMTDKDAVKCRALVDARLWRVPLQIEMTAEHQGSLWRAVQHAIDARAVR